MYLADPLRVGHGASLRSVVVLAVVTISLKPTPKAACTEVQHAAALVQASDVTV